MSTVLCFSDTHAPFMHKKAIPFLKDVRDKYKPDIIVHGGDVVDNHMSGSYAKHDRAFGTLAEIKKAQKAINSLQAVFPKVKVCIGNHDNRPSRIAAQVALNSWFLQTDYAKVWHTPGWDWKYEWTIDGVRYFHGIGSTGKNCALNRALDNMQSTVQGHTHTFPGVAYNACAWTRVFGMNTGSLMDTAAYAAEYSKAFVHKPVLGCGLVVDGDEAIFIPMDLGTKRRRQRKGIYK